MNLKDLKKKTPAELLTLAEELEIENASTLRKQEMLFAILKQTADNGTAIFGEGVLEVLSDGFGFLRSPQSNYLAGPDDIYVSPTQIKKFSLRTGDTVEGEVVAPKEGERYFALVDINQINYEEPEKVKSRINFDNLTPLFPTEKLKLESDNPPEPGKDKNKAELTSRIIEIVAAAWQGPARDHRCAAAHR